MTNVSSIGGGKVVTGGSDGRSVAWDVDSGEVSHSIMMLGEIPSSGISSVGEGKVLVRTTNSYINLFDMGSKKLLFSIYDRHICALVAFPDQKRAAIAYTSGVEIWDFVSRDTVRVIKVSSFLSYRNWCLCVYAGGSRLVSGYGEQGGLCSWDVESGERIHTFMGHHCRINSVCVLEKENLLVSASNGDIRVWDLKTGKFLKILEGHTGCILSVASFGDGLRVVSGSADTTLRVWNVVTGKCTHVLKGHTDGVRQVCCLDNNQIVSVSDDKTARVWG